MAHAPFCNTPFLQFLVSCLGTQRNLNQHSQAIFLFKRTSNFKFCYAYAPLLLICTWSPFLLNRHKPTQLNFTASSTVSGSWGWNQIYAPGYNNRQHCHDLRPIPPTWGEPRVETGRRKVPESKTTWTGGRWRAWGIAFSCLFSAAIYTNKPHFLTSPDAIYTPAEKLSARQMLGNSTIYRGVYSSYPWRLEASILKSSYKKTRGKTSSESGKELPHPLFWSQLWDLSQFGSHLPFQSKPPFPLPWKPLETSLHNRSWHWFLKFVSCEVKPYSSKSKPRTAVQRTSSQDKMLLPSPHSGHRNKQLSHVYFGFQALLLMPFA